MSCATSMVYIGGHTDLRTAVLPGHKLATQKLCKTEQQVTKQIFVKRRSSRHLQSYEQPGAFDMRLSAISLTQS